jgi:hypothetical protein
MMHRIEFQLRRGVSEMIASKQNINSRNIQFSDSSIKQIRNN